MIKQSSIDELRAKADLTDVVSRYTTVKKNMACCPMHDEKSPSFHLYQAKQTYKCFGCGESGDVFKLAMKMEHLNFVEAAEWLAAHYNISLEYDQQSQAEAQEVKDKRTEMLQLTEWAHRKYKEALSLLPAEAPALQYLYNRGYNDEKIGAWDIGFAPDNWDYIKSAVINMGKHAIGVECGLLGTKEGRSWDFYRNRITIPIHDQNGIIVGLAGRLVPSGNADEDKKQPKYLNPQESLLYSKKKVWYGLWQAQKAIKECGFAYLVEGYFDVQAMHDNGILNTIAASGTEVDELQVKFLKRYTDHLVLGFDGDKPGTKKQMKLLDLFLKQDFKVQVLALPDELDPDEYINQLQLTPAEATTEVAYAE